MRLAAALTYAEHVLIDHSSIYAPCHGVPCVRQAAAPTRRTAGQKPPPLVANQRLHWALCERVHPGRASCAVSVPHQHLHRCVYTHAHAFMFSCCMSASRFKATAAPAQIYIIYTIHTCVHTERFTDCVIATASPVRKYIRRRTFMLNICKSFESHRSTCTYAQTHTCTCLMLYVCAWFQRHSSTCAGTHAKYTPHVFILHASYCMSASWSRATAALCTTA